MRPCWIFISPLCPVKCILNFLIVQPKISVKPAFLFECLQKSHFRRYRTPERLIQVGIYRRERMPMDRQPVYNSAWLFYNPAHEAFYKIFNYLDLDFVWSGGTISAGIFKINGRRILRLSFPARNYQATVFELPHIKRFRLDYNGRNRADRRRSRRNYRRNICAAARLAK